VSRCPVPVTANFYERDMKGEKFTPNWVKSSDLEKGPLD
jgi:hypothetical protein